MRPLQSLDGNKKLILCSLYLLIGIAMIAMSFNLVQEQASTVQDISVTVTSVTLTQYVSSLLLTAKETAYC